MDFTTSAINSVNIGETTFRVWTKEDEKDLKGYQFDSLVYRYIRAREQMAEYEYLVEKGLKKQDKTFYYKNAERDIMRFIQILNEVIGERN